MKVLLRLLVFGLLVAGAAGCSKGGVKKATIDGTVTYRGEPLRSGILRVVGAGGEFATAPIRADGTFTLTEFELGKKAVLQRREGAGDAPAGNALTGEPSMPTIPVAGATNGSYAPFTPRHTPKNGESDVL